MKRLATITLLSGLLLLACSPSASAASVPKIELYSAYMNFIEDRLDAVGYIQPSTADGVGGMGSKSPGVVYTELVDFDGDGQEELYMLEFVKGKTPLYGDYYPCDLTWFVYTYQNGIVTLSNSGEVSAITLDFGITQGKSGKIYIYDATSYPTWEAWELSDGVWHHTEVSALFVPSYSSRWNVNGEYIYVSSGEGRYSYNISKDNELIVSSTDERPAQLLEEIGGDARKPFDHFFNRPSDGTPQALIQRLESKYVPSYRVPSNWAQNTITQAINSGIVPSHLQKNYQKPITRAEFCSLAVVYYENVTNTTISECATFNDTSDINVQKMAGLGVVNGVGNGCFDPNATLTREQAATMLARLAIAMKNPIQESQPTFSDNLAISSWAQSAVGQMQLSGIMGGVGNNYFDPQSAYTREQSIITMKRMDIQIVPCEEIKLNAGGLSSTELGIEPIRIETSRLFTAEIFPENTTNKTITWTSSDESIATVSSSGTVRGIKPGTVTITATAKSGVSTSADVIIRDYMTVNLPVTVNCVQHDSWNRGTTADYLPDNPIYAGSIQINTCEIFPVVMGKNKLRIQGSVSDLRSDLSYLSPAYIKWVIKDFAGKILDSGITYSTSGANEVGDTVTFFIESDYLGSCYLEFISDQGASEEELFKDMPTIELPKFPISSSIEKRYQDFNYLTGETEYTIYQDQITIENIEPVFSYDDKYDTYLLDFIFSGTAAVNEHSLVSPRIKWTLIDESGHYISSSTFDVSDSGSFSWKISVIGKYNSTKIKPGQKYILMVDKAGY